MPEMHNALHRGALSRAIKDAVGATKSDGGLERYSETLQGVIDLWRLPEWAYLRGESLMMFGAIASAVAGEFSYNGIENPAGSEEIVVVDELLIEGAGTYNIRFRCTDVPTVSAGVIRRDLRWPAAQVSRSLFISGAEAAGSGANMLRFSLPAAATQQPLWMPLGIVLPPGTNVVVEHGTVNTAFTGNWKWRARAALPGELG
jgi:hypothetical protein